MADEIIGFRDRRRGFFITDNAIIDHYLKKMGPYGYLVYGVVLRHVRTQTRNTFIRQERIAKMANISRRTVQRELDNLVTLGLLRRTLGKEQGQENLYEICDIPTALPDPVDNTPVSVAKDAPPVAGDAPGCVNDDSKGASMTTAYKEEQDVSNKTNTSQRLFEDAEAGSSKPRAAPNTLHHQVIAEITRLFELGNPGIKCEWTGLAMKRWGVEQKKRPRWTLEQWLQCVRNRFASDNINVGEPPENLIPSLPRYISGPLTQYNRSKRDTDDRRRPQTAADRNIAAAEAALADLEGAASDGDGDGD